MAGLQRSLEKKYDDIEVVEITDLDNCTMDLSSPAGKQLLAEWSKCTREYHPVHAEAFKVWTPAAASTPSLRSPPMGSANLKIGPVQMPAVPRKQKNIEKDEGVLAGLVHTLSA